MDLLLLSNSSNHGAVAFEHVRAELAEFYGDREVLFVPYAQADHDACTEVVARAFAAAGVRVRGLHVAADPAAELRAAAAVFVGGGNSFRLLRRMQSGGQLAALRSAVEGGARYGGASAGTNLACPTVRTTNDMPIVQPDGFAALGLVGFQINPHYQDPDPDSQHMGETRQQRIGEFLEENDVPVLGLREGAWLRVADSTITLRGHTARLFLRGADPRELVAGADLSFLAGSAGEFDVPAR